MFQNYGIQTGGGSVTKLSTRAVQSQSTNPTIKPKHLSINMISIEARDVWQEPKVASLLTQDAQHKTQQFKHTVYILTGV